MELLDIGAQKDFFTSDNRFFFRVISYMGNKVAAKSFEKINGVYQEKRCFITTLEELTEGLDQYNEEVDNWEDEFYDDEL